MKRKILKIMIATMLLTTLTMSNFVYVGASIISYAADSIATNHKNVEFSAEINENNKLILQINVNNEGYFNGEIALSESNFKFKNVDSQYVNKLEENKITLNQLNAGTVAQIEIEVEPIKDDLFNIGLLNMDSSLSLTGIYRDSTEKNIKIESERTVKLGLSENNDEQNIENSMEVITNKVVKISGEEKRVVQLSLNMGLKENNYPIHMINSKIVVPVIDGEQPQVVVNAKMNNMTAYDYKYENATLEITMKNEANSENKVMWQKSGTENVIVTLIYNETAKVDETKIDIQNNIELYNSKQLNTNVSVNLTSEEKDSIIEATTINSESSIFKGKMYSGIARTYENTTKIDVNLIGVAKYIEVLENPSTYIVNETETDANIFYTQTKINKEQLLKVFGEDGKLTITTAAGAELATIDANSETDEQGNVIITYNDKIKAINIKTSEPKNLGSIEIKHTKTIEETEKEIIKSAVAISTKITQKYNNLKDLEETYSIGSEEEKAQRIELKETSTQATISMNKNSLSTLSANNVEINAILKSSNEENDLYKNPRLQIILPQEIESITVNTISKIYADEFEFTTTTLTEEPGVGKVITIELAGEQTSYLNDVAEGMHIVINADITFSKTTPSRTANITMKYINENGAQAEYEAQTSLNIVSQYGMFVYSKVSGFNQQGTILETEENGIVEGKLDIADENEKVVTIERYVMNNYEEKIEGINIVGKIPEVGEEEIDGTKLNSTFVASLQEVLVNSENAKIYYSEKADITAESAEWQEQIEDITKVKSYKIELADKALEPGQMATISYKIKIPANLKYNESTYENFNLSYQYKDQTLNKNYTTYLSTITVDNPEAVVKSETLDSFGVLSISAVSGGQELKDGQEIYEGQTVTVDVQLTNDTGADLKNVKIIATQENGIFYTKNVTQELDTQTLEQMDVTTIIEDETIENKEFTIEELKNGETISYEYQFSVKEKPGEETKGLITIEADGIEKQEITTMTNKIKDAKLKLNVRCNYNEERTLLAGSVFPITLSAKNISDKELKNVVLELAIPEGTSFDETYLIEEDYYTYMGTEDGVAKFKINSIASGETVEIILSLAIDEFKEDLTNINTTITSTIDDETYISNEINREVIQEKAEITVTLKGNRNISVIKTGEEVIYTATIKNASSRSQAIEIIDNVPTAAVVRSAYIVSNGERTEISEISENNIQYETQLDGEEEIELVVETVIDENSAQASEITNEVEVNAYNQYIKSNGITYRLANIVDEENPVEQANNSISGKIWLDSNRNGQIDEDETPFANTEVKLLNAITGEVVKDSNNQEVTATTNENGEYEFTKLENNQYIVLIEFDTTKYSLTEYKKAGISEETNSDVIAKEVNGKAVAVTDAIEINATSARNINAGLVENKIFDLKLDKYINKVTIQNSAGTKLIEYTKAQLAKVEIDAKQVNNSTVLVEYGFDITNEGEVPGYVNEIIDYIPNNFKFSSEINKSWYTTTDENTLHNISLTNDVINPGETKTITLTLVKTMNENNIGTAVNTAEITKTSNHLLIDDKDSTPGNNAKGEDDISTAELIISIRTGVGIAITVTIVIIAIIGLVAVVIILKKRGE